MQSLHGLPHRWPMPASHLNLRRGRHSRSGQIYLVTFATLRRIPHFADWPVASLAAKLMSDAANWQESRLLAWVLMPDHWHGLIELNTGDTLANRVGWIKAQSARQLRKTQPGLGRIWARAYHDHALRREQDVLDVARYLLMNPVRAGLATSVRLYPFWDAVWLESSRL